jgi:hypothetical protein
MLLSLALFTTGCRVVQNTAELPGKTVGLVTQAGKPKPPAMDPVEVQQTVLRCANEFSTGMIVAVDKLRRGTNALDPAEALQWKIALDTETTAIASGPNAVASLLDLTVFVAVTRAAVEEHWLPEVFGGSAQPMLELCRGVETNLWLNAAKILTGAQQEELRSAIQNWRRQHPEAESVLSARAVGFTSQLALAGRADPANPGSVFSLLLLDPLAGMDPAVREIAQTRILAERALYVAQRMPRLARWQTELLSLNTVHLPAVQQIVSNSTRLTSSVEAFAQVADQLPQLVNGQREAAIKQIFEGLAVERTNLIANLAADDFKLRATLAELHQTLDAGNDLMKSSATTIQSLDAFMGRFDTGTNAPVTAATNSRPFDIREYAATAKEVTTTLKELNATINSLDQTVPPLQNLAATIESAGQRLLKRALFMVAGLIALFWIGALMTAVIYRRAVRRG